MSARDTTRLAPAVMPCNARKNTSVATLVDIAQPAEATTNSATPHITTGRLDTRFSGPDMDPLSQRANYDPQSTALSSAYVSAYNDYANRELHYGDGRQFKLSIPIFRSWNGLHKQPGQESTPTSAEQGLNVMPDLANAMKANPKLKVLLNAGYFDLATPYYEGVYEMHHLPMPAELQKNIEYKFYESGHMVYAKDSSLKELHDVTAAFIRKNSTH